MVLLINDLRARISCHRADIDRAIARVIDRGWLVLGPEVCTFETAFAEYVGVSHCIGVGNGTDALEIALRAMGVSSGTKVALAANAGFYATTALLAIAALPHYVDVDIETSHLRLADVKEAIAAGAETVVITHLYGAPVGDISDIAHLCAENGVPMLEDCAQAHGARIDGRCVGSFGDAASFSFYPTKNLGALGDGGAILTRNRTIAEKSFALRQYGWTTKYLASTTGARNSRLDEIQAAILSELLPFLDAENLRRREIAAFYLANIKHPEVALPKFDEGAAPHLYVVRTKDREGLRKHLSSFDIASDVHYPVPDHRQPCHSEMYGSMSLPVTERLSREVLTLPCFSEMHSSDIELVVEAVNSWVR